MRLGWRSWGTSRKDEAMRDHRDALGRFSRALRQARSGAGLGRGGAEWRRG
jgi:hypothetical protein